MSRQIFSLRGEVYGGQSHLRVCVVRGNPCNLFDNGGRFLPLMCREPSSKLPRLGSGQGNILVAAVTPNPLGSGTGDDEQPEMRLAVLHHSRDGWQ